jgi:hypothetical protein
MTDNKWLVLFAVGAIAVTVSARAFASSQRPTAVGPKVIAEGRATGAGTTTVTAPTITPTVGVAPQATVVTRTVTTTIIRNITAAPAAPVAPVTAKTGDVVRFGRFHGTALEWRILSIDKKRITLLADQAVIAGPYQSHEYAADPADYASSSVRAWLKDVFVPSAFGANAEDEDALARSSASDAIAGDIAYLLTASQVDRYLPEAEDRVAPSTAWAQANAGYGGVPLAAGPVYWWLAPDPGTGPGNTVPVVQTNGAVNRLRYAAVAVDGVRPAIKLNAAAVTLAPVAGSPGVFNVVVR